MGKLKIASIGSSSSGNAYIVSDGETRLLLDVGLTAKRIKEGLAACRLSPEDIQGIFVTHEHTDHVKSIRAMAKVCVNAKVYTSRGTAYNCDKFEHIDTGKLHYMSSQGVINLGSMNIKAFSLSHDAAEPLGFTFTTGEDRLAVATDTGIVTDEIEEEVRAANKLVLEANHEENILQMGPYPYSLKRRILGDYGHLSNVTSGITIARSLLERTNSGLGFSGTHRSVNYDTENVNGTSAHDSRLNSGGQHIMLAHLSSQNNTPDTAFITVKNILEENGLGMGRAYSLTVAAKDTLSFLG